MANCSLALPAFANERVYPATAVAYTVEIEDNKLLEQATKISEKETRENGRVITTTVYRLKSGSLVTDVFERGDISIARSTSDSDTATRSCYVEGTTVSMTASFKWYPVNNLYQKVECTNATGSYSLSGNNIVKEYCETSRPTTASTTPVKATMSYKFHEKRKPIPVQQRKLLYKMHKFGINIG